ncbi:MAG: hypothetical protein N2321_00610 [Melioribacteraceae bacterium]|nr:hypothetical protein [Melioribacteraceae bacterium]
MNVAIIDIGTNSFHLIIATIYKNNYKIIHQVREVFHLRKNSESKSYTIDNEKIIEGIDLLINFKDISKNYNAKIFAFGTSVLRDAINKDDFINQVKSKCDIEIYVLTGEEEAELITHGINYHYDVENKNLMIFDLGGGSTEFVHLNKNEIYFKKSFNIGAVRQTQKWFSNYVFTSENIVNCIKDIENEIKELNTDVELVYGIGGTITALTWLIEKNIYNREHNFKVIPNYLINKNDFIFVKELIINSAINNNLNEKIGIDDNRLKIIVAGTLIVDYIFNKFNCESIIAAGISIRESFLIKNFLA